MNLGVMVGGSQRRITEEHTHAKVSKDEHLNISKDEQMNRGFPRRMEWGP